MKIISHPEARTIRNLEISENQQYLLAFISKATTYFGHNTRTMEKVYENS